MLPEFLYREICREALTPFLWKHAVLHDLATRHQCFQYDLCVQCMVDWNVGSHEMLFSARTKCDNMLIIAQGTIAYQKSASDFLETRSTCTTATTMTTIASAASLSPRPSLSNLDTPDAILSSPGEWLCEASLWCPWLYMGRAVSETRAVLLCLSHQKLLAIASRNKEASRKLVAYARHFVRYLQQVPEEHLSDLPLDCSFEVIAPAAKLSLEASPTSRISS